MWYIKQPELENLKKELLNVETKEIDEKEYFEIKEPKNDEEKGKNENNSIRDIIDFTPIFIHTVNEEAFKKYSSNNNYRAIRYILNTPAPKTLNEIYEEHYETQTLWQSYC